MHDKSCRLFKQVGKLVDRRVALTKALKASNHNSRVEGFLVCRLPRDQIAVALSDSAKHKITLITHEDLLAAIEALRSPSNPDAMLDSVARRMLGWGNEPNG